VEAQLEPLKSLESRVSILAEGGDPIFLSYDLFSNVIASSDCHGAKRYSRISSILDGIIITFKANTKHPLNRSPCPIMHLHTLILQNKTLPRIIEFSLNPLMNHSPFFFFFDHSNHTLIGAT
jgi:hypothetical protein